MTSSIPLHNCCVIITNRKTKIKVRKQKQKNDQKINKLNIILYKYIDKFYSQCYDIRKSRKDRNGMKKTLYSLMLNDEVVREVDALAHRLGTNRSALINQILAEYVDYTTPERRINDVLSAIEQLMAPSRELVPFFAPNTFSMSLKSSLEYKYRPTVKYEVELYRGTGESIGELSVVFRTQSGSLIQAMTSFFRLWKRIEDAHLAPLTGNRAEYALYDGKFVRSISAPDKDCSTDELASALAEYIKLFDRMMKNYLTGRMDEHEVEAAYYSQMINSEVHI